MTTIRWAGTTAPPAFAPLYAAMAVAVRLKFLKPALLAIILNMGVKNRLSGLLFAAVILVVAFTALGTNPVASGVKLPFQTPTTMSFV